MKTALAAVLLASSLFAADYSHSRAITINHYKVQNIDHSDFVVTIAGTFDYLKDVAYGGDVQSSGLDIVFTNHPSCSLATSSRLPFERAAYNGASGTVEFHVALPLITSGYDTVFYMCYGRASDSDHQSAARTWPASDYKAVYHFGDGNTLSLTDSTTHHNDCTNYGGTAAAGVVGPGALHLTGSAYLNCGHSSSLNITGPLWIEAFFSVDSMPPGTFETLIGKSRGANGWDYLLHDNTGWTAGRMYGQFLNGGVFTVVGAFLPTEGVPYLATVVYDQGQSNYLSTWINANNDGVQGTAGTAVGSHLGTDMLIGAYTDTPSPTYTWQGTIDELRIRTRIPGTDYMATQRNMLTDPATFYTIGADVTP